MMDFEDSGIESDPKNGAGTDLGFLSEKVSANIASYENIVG
jgi:hypothetical protein